VNDTCHRCGAIAPAGTQFHSELFSRKRVYCPKCSSRFEEKFIIGTFALLGIFGLFGVLALWKNPSSEVGHVYTNIFLIEFVLLPSTIVHEFAHAIVGRLLNLTVTKIWIGRGKTFYQANLLGFRTEFKTIPVGGFTFLAPKEKEKLRLRYFFAIFAGPFANAIILATVWKFVSWKSLDIQSSIQLPAIIFLAQAAILIGNLLPYRIQTAFGLVFTDGLCLIQLLNSKTPECLQPRFAVNISPQKQIQAK
jgi:hypothetical protein